MLTKSFELLDSKFYSCLDLIKKSIKKHRQIYPDIRIKDVYWESILYYSMQKAGYTVYDWDPSSHKSDEDFKCLEFGSISCKSFNTKFKADSHISISGPRTVSRPKIQDKLDWLNSVKSNYVFCLDYDKNKLTSASSFVILNLSKLDYCSDFSWEETNRGWIGTHNNTSRIEIIRSLSEQVWYDYASDFIMYDGEI